jgi:hypothetical protein
MRKPVIVISPFLDSEEYQGAASSGGRVVGSAMMDPVGSLALFPIIREPHRKSRFLDPLTGLWRPSSPYWLGNEMPHEATPIKPRIALKELR